MANQRLNLTAGACERLQAIICIDRQNTAAAIVTARKLEYSEDDIAHIKSTFSFRDKLEDLCELSCQGLGRCALESSGAGMRGIHKPTDKINPYTAQVRLLDAVEIVGYYATGRFDPKRDTI